MAYRNMRRQKNRVQKIHRDNKAKLAEQLRQQVFREKAEALRKIKEVMNPKPPESFIRKLIRKLHLK
ncbi:MAG: hypothetical protein MUO72_09535 [Bacteroidales bacterium]|nr:hypothetical protein [Bacteroidales bacterium]